MFDPDEFEVPDGAHGFAITISAPLGETPTATLAGAEDLDAAFGPGAAEKLQFILDFMIAEGRWQQMRPETLIMAAFSQFLEAEGYAEGQE